MSLRCAGTVLLHVSLHVSCVFVCPWCSAQTEMHRQMTARIAQEEQQMVEMRQHLHHITQYFTHHNQLYDQVCVAVHLRLAFHSRRPLFRFLLLLHKSL